jgi:hypothetical protein
LRADISDTRYLRDRRIGLVMAAVWVVWLAIAIAAPNLAAGSTSPHASTSLYRLSLRISSKRFLGDGAENPIAVDRNGNAYTFRATRTQQGSIPSGDAPDVDEISPAGKPIRSFSTTFRVRGHRHYLQVNGLAVTPNGHDVFVVGNLSVQGCTTLPLHSATPAEREVVYVSPPFVGLHTIEINTSGGGPVALDGFVVLG